MSKATCFSAPSCAFFCAPGRAFCHCACFRSWFLGGCLGPFCVLQFVLCGVRFVPFCVLQCVLLGVLLCACFLVPCFALSRAPSCHFACSSWCLLVGCLVPTLCAPVRAFARAPSCPSSCVLVQESARLSVERWRGPMEFPEWCPGYIARRTCKYWGVNSRHHPPIIPMRCLFAYDHMKLLKYSSKKGKGGTPWHPKK